MTPMRKMRRSREVAASTSSGTDEILSGFGLYELQGDARAALDAFTTAAQQESSTSTTRRSTTTVAASCESGKITATDSVAGGRKKSSSAARASPSPLRQEHQNLAGSETATPTRASRYNTMLLRQVVARTPARDKGILLAKLDEVESLFKDGSDDHLVSARKRKRNEMILAYNRALVLQAAGENIKCASICSSVLKEMIESKLKPSEEIAVVSSRMSLLLLECILALSVGRNSGLVYKQFDVPHPDVILSWLDLLDTEKDPQHKFLLALYKSRIALAELNDSGTHIDSKVRGARKELKMAMEVFQHKLRPSFGGDSGSVVSSAASEENNVNNPQEQQQQHLHQQQHHHHQPQPTGSAVLQKHNQSALSLKANLEQLKGNTKKSLILCSEALGAARHDWAYQTVHENNLSVVYETNDKRLLALHGLSKSLQANINAIFMAPGGGSDEPSADGSAPLFGLDGTARLDHTLLILHNAALCSLRARKYQSAYECMATCCTRSDVFANRPRCWLRLAEACIGIFAGVVTEGCQQQQQHHNANAPSGKVASGGVNANRNRFCVVKIDGEPHGLVLDRAVLTDHVEAEWEELAPVMGSMEDLEQVKRNPLLRARFALERVLRQHVTSPLERGDLISARLAMSYVYLSFRDHKNALELARLVLDNDMDNTNMAPTKADATSSSPRGGGAADEVTVRLLRRQMATARMYAAEASCALGEMVDAMKFLVGDGKDDAFDRLAFDLGGVTLETAACSTKGKRRLAKAQTMVRASACAVTASMGNAQAAKQLANSALANSANTMANDACETNRERSSARRALIYTLLREGQQSAALNILLSSR